MTAVKSLCYDGPMFTGLIEEMGVVQGVAAGPKTVRLTVVAKTVLGDLSPGDSLTVNGACLTVVERSDTGFSSDLSLETTGATTLGELKTGDAVNLERAMRVNSRLGGHLVTGHVDGIGWIRERKKDGEDLVLWIEIPKDLARYCIPKGSISLDGVSLTINQTVENRVRVAIIPHTARATTLGLKAAGSAVNVECDLIGKFVERLIQERAGVEPPGRVDRDYLKRKGLL